jgi:hypothetical protein
VSAGQIPLSTIPAGPSDTVLISWTADSITPGSCSLQEPNGTAGFSPVVQDSGEVSITLGSAASRVFQLSCLDLNNVPYQLQTAVYQPPQVTLNPTTTPGTGVAGTDTVGVTGSGFVAGTITPGNVIVSLAASCGGTPVGYAQAAAVTAAVGTATAVTSAAGTKHAVTSGGGGTTQQVQFQVPAVAAGTYFVAMEDLAAGDVNFTSSSCSSLIVTALPVTPVPVTPVPVAQ